MLACGRGNDGVSYGAIDLDEDDPERAAQLLALTECVFGKTLRRVGRPNRRVLLYALSSGTSASRNLHQKVQLLADRKCVVLFGKYLSRRQQSLVALQSDGRFGIDPESALWLSYDGFETLSDMVKATADLAGPEKIGLHALLLASPHVVDVEIAFGGGVAAPVACEATSEDGALADGANAAAQAEADIVTGSNGYAAPINANRRQDRLDVATLEERDGSVFVVFHEAKHFANPELRASTNRTPPIVEQIARYRRTLSRNADAIGQSYRDVCAALAHIAAQRRTVQDAAGAASAPVLDPLIARIAADGLVPQVDPEPRLVVFGFDRDQRDGALACYTERLRAEHGLTVYALGNPAVKASAAFRPSRP